MKDGLEKCYEILEIAQDASWEEVQRAYHELVKVWHPDRFVSDQRLQVRAERRLQRINEAYRRLEQQRGLQATGPPVAHPEPAPSAASPVGAPKASAPNYPPRTKPPSRATPWFPSIFKIPVLRPIYGFPPMLRAAILSALLTALTLGGGLFFFRFLTALRSSTATGVDLASGTPPHSLVPPQFGRRIDLTAIPERVPRSLSDEQPESELPSPLPTAGPSRPDSAHDDFAGRGKPKSLRTKPGASQAKPVQLRPQNGADLVEPQGQGGAGMIRIINHRGEDLIAEIWETDTRTRLSRAVYVRSGEEATMQGMSLGVYRARFRAAVKQGRDPGNLPSASYRLPDAMQFYDVEGAGGTQSVLYVITIP